MGRGYSDQIPNKQAEYTRPHIAGIKSIGSPLRKGSESLVNQFQKAIGCRVENRLSVIQGSNFIPLSTKNSNSKIPSQALVENLITADETAASIISLLLEVKEQNNMILAAVNEPPASSTNLDATEWPVNLPVQTEEALQELCAHLSYKNNFDALVKHLSSVGGTNLNNKINNILRRCLSNEVARNYNFRGQREGKRAFQDLTLKHVILCAAKISEPNATEIDIENSIKVWLRHAPQRCKIKHTEH